MGNTMSKLLNGLSKASVPIPHTSYLKSHEKGSVFLEILVSLGIIAIIGTSLMLTLILVSSTLIRAEREAIAAGLGREEMEILRGIPVTELPIQTDGPLIGDFTSALADLPAGTGLLTIELVGNNPDLKQVTVVIAFQHKGQTVTLPLTTLMTTGGLNG